MARLDRLVVFIPGFGGSELADSSDRVVWGGSTRAVCHRLLHPDQLSIEENPQLRATGLLRVAAALPGLAALHPYDNLLTAISETFTNARIDLGDVEKPDLSANFVAFAYDWRQPIETVAQRLADSVRMRLAYLGKRGHQPEVVVLAHSLGGLVARYWLGPLDGRRVCSHLVTFGTPHRGSPKALDVLMTGARIGPLRLDRLTKVLAGFESTHVLVPRYPMIADGDRLIRPADRDLGPLTQNIRRALNTHLDIESAWKVPSRTVVVPVFGHGHSTTAQARLNSHGQLVFEGADVLSYSEGWDGDATVPQVSAIPIEMSDDPNSRALWRPSPARHSRLVDGLLATSMLRAVGGQSISAAREHTPPAVTLGLRLPDSVLLGDRLDINVVAHGMGQAGDLAVDGRVTHLESGITTPLRFASTERGWRSSVIARNRGAVAVLIRGQPMNGTMATPTVEDTVVVMDPDGSSPLRG